MLDCILKGRRGIATAEFICGEIITTEKTEGPLGPNSTAFQSTV